jgi:DNA-binding response OmpR family regulator
MERRWFEELGADVTPVLSNDEAITEIGRQRPHLIISDIARGEQEDGSELGIRLAAAGMNPPILFYVSRVDLDKPLPAGAVGITNDPADLLRDALGILKPAH